MKGLSVFSEPAAAHANKVLFAQYQSHLRTVIRNALFPKPNFNSNYFLNQIFYSNYLVIRNASPN